MPKYIVLDIDADPSVTFDQVSLSESPFRLKSLVGLWRPEKSVFVNSILSTVPTLSGNIPLVSSDTFSAPSVQNSSGYSTWAITDNTKGTRLISGPNKPTASPFVDLRTTGYTIMFPFLVTNNATGERPLITIDSLLVSLTTTSRIKMQKAFAEPNIVVLNSPVVDATKMATLGISYNRSTNNIKVYWNGVEIYSATNSRLNFNQLPGTDPLVYMAIGNGQSSSSALGNFGELYAYNAVLSADEILELSNYLKTKYSIS